MKIIKTPALVYSEYEYTGLAYTRVSTDADRQKNSVDVQTTKIREYAQWKGIKIPDDGWFADEESGKTKVNEREGGKKLLERLSLRKEKHLIINKLDRFGRNAIDIQSTWLYLTNELGVVIHVLDLGGDSLSSDNPMSKMIVGLLSLFAEFERDRITGRIIETFDVKFARRECIGRIPFGFRGVETDQITKAGKKLKLIEIDPTEILWARKIILYHLHGSGDGKGPWTFNKIITYLNRIGVPTKHSGRWNPTTLKRWFECRHITDYMQRFYNSKRGAFIDAKVNEGDPQNL